MYRATGEDFLSVAGGSSCEALAFLSRGPAAIVRMRGLPYDCSAQQVLDFFSSGENACTVLDGLDGVLFVKKPDGRATGDAFVLFADISDAPKALAKHRQNIGSRYIELYRSTTAEVLQVLNRSMMMEPRPTPQLPPMPMPNYSLLPQDVITSGTRKDCVRLRGLPYESQMQHILDFLGEYAKNIMYQGVHMVNNAQGQPSGEAFIRMDSEQSAFVTAEQKHYRYMIFGKKQRYIEVFQCSGEDMNLALTEGLPAPTSPAKATAPAPTHSPPPATQSTLWDPALLQAQQNLIAPQTQAHAQSEMLLMNQIAHSQGNLAMLPSPLFPGNAAKMQQFIHMTPVQNPYVALLPCLPVYFSGNCGPNFGLLGAQFPPTPGLLPMVPHAAMKRSYGDAFQEQAATAKIAYVLSAATSTGSACANAVPMYQHFYSPL
ncbi:unnamed protein product [Ceutorhynchus assimilis]|uniref:RRM domain-containing protein n=1 Tax=Ceutorhynchus assimilis TaxID=467358 RepID=A0A9N9MJ19_9CUCU|nr:unnamed protein product [Ceutorhynchus assimilis]